MTKRVTKKHKKKENVLRKRKQGKKVKQSKAALPGTDGRLELETLETGYLNANAMQTVLGSILDQKAPDIGGIFMPFFLFFPFSAN